MISWHHPFTRSYLYVPSLDTFGTHRLSAAVTVIVDFTKNFSADFSLFENSRIFFTYLGAISSYTHR